MDWIELQNEEQLDKIKELSTSKAQVIFKHSTRCSISSVVKNRLDNTPAPQDVDFYGLDLIRHRNISDKIAELFSVYHESPQILLIKNGECVYDESHHGISMAELVEEIQK